MTEHEALKQLIEDVISMMEYHVEQTRPIHETTVALQAAKDALKSMDKALAQPEQEPQKGGCTWCGGDCPQFECDTHSTWMNEPVIRRDLPPQPKEPEQEPVAWATQMGEYAHIHWGAKRPEYPMVYEVPLYTSPQPAIQQGWDVDDLLNRPKQPAQQEPVALETVYETIIQWDEGGGKRSRRELARRIVALYTTPPQRTWVGLTEEDKQIAFDDTQEGGGFWEFADAIEAKLKEKNT